MQSQHFYLRATSMLYSPLYLGLPSGLFASGFTTTIPYTFLFSPHMSHAPAISSSLTSSPKQLECTSHEAPCYAIFFVSSHLLLGPNIFFSTLFSNTLSLCSSHYVSSKVTYPDTRTGKIWVLYILIQDTLQKAWDLNGLPQLLMFLADDPRWRSVFSAWHCTSTVHLSEPQG